MGRRRYTDAEKAAALYSVREVGVRETSRRLAIPVGTLTDWKAATRAYAYAPFVGRGRTISERERQLLLAQLVHEQELELRLIGSSRARHDARGASKLGKDAPLDVLLNKAGVIAPHLVEWLDPTFDEVAERLAA